MRMKSPHGLLGRRPDHGVVGADLRVTAAFLGSKQCRTPSGVACISNGSALAILWSDTPRVRFTPARQSLAVCRAICDMACGG
jgi:hypothetical protein